MYEEEDLLPLSGLQHLRFCPRQCALIHAEGQWAENRLTALGRFMHDNAHEEKTTLEDGVLFARGLRLKHTDLGLYGCADVVEFHPDENGTPLAGRRGRWLPYPVEYKHGQPKKNNADAVQLCAQALCLEEMLGVVIPTGALFYGKTKRRKCVTFDGALRQETIALARSYHALLQESALPAPLADNRCAQCSLSDICQPESLGCVQRYMEHELNHLREDGL